MSEIKETTVSVKVSEDMEKKIIKAMMWSKYLEAFKEGLYCGLIFALIFLIIRFISFLGYLMQ